MDLGDVHLPKQIIDVTEIMILEIKQKSEKFHDLIMFQHKNSHSKAETTTACIQG